MQHSRLTRRQFLERGAAAAGIAAAPLLAHGQPGNRPISANNKILLGFVGVGGMGRSHFDRLIENPEVRLAAVCDVDARRRRAAMDFAVEHGQPAAGYNDFREMLDRHPELDAVFVATPDHWHALATIHAIRAGKDVYCEKPLALTIGEGRKMVEAARRYNRVVQVGTMQRSDMPQFRHACELVRNGRIGALERVVCFFGPNPRADYVPEEPPPNYLDWNRYLGPAPRRAYNPLIHPYNFRYFRDYSGGMLTDWGVHLFDIAQWGMGADQTSPRRVEAEFTYYRDNMYEFPKQARIAYQYAGVTLEWVQGFDEEFEPGEGYGTKFYGSEGEVFVNRSGYAARNKQGGPVNETIGPYETHLYAAASHHQDFFDCMRTRARPICDVAIGHRTTTISHLGNIAGWLGRPLDYDPDREVFPDHEPANRLLFKPMRAPWHV